METAVVAATSAYVLARYIDTRFAISSDVSMISRLRSVARVQTDLKDWNIARLWFETVKKHPNKIAIIFEGKTWTFQDIENQSNKIANWAVSQGIQVDETVALFMENRAEYIITWLGLTKACIRIALINCNLKLRPLVHSITVISPKWLIVGSELIGSIPDILGELKGINIAVYGPEPADFGVHLDPILEKQPVIKLPDAITNKHKMSSVFGYMYTSGTTGLPKAAVILQARMCGAGSSFLSLFTPEDRFYTALPLYHLTGGVMGTGTMTIGGTTLVLARKFSASRFWQEVSESEATFIQYIGELCRYLVNSPPSPYDRKHKVRMAVGNGLRPEIWRTFQERFNVPEIGELYGSTEGTIGMFNYCRNFEGVGHCGRFGIILRKLTGAKLVKFDVEKEEPIRGANGFCIECGINEPGELIGPLNETTRFAGYTDQKASEKKLLRDVFVKGDCYFRTGDLLSLNERSYYTFVDRIGDTFRWHGENVSTNEVSEVVGFFPQVKEANIYGVKIPGTEGRACMGALVVDEQIDWRKFAQHVTSQLPSYAVPLFIRLLPEMEITGTFKHQKVALRDQGFDPAKIREPLLWFNGATKNYEPLTQQVFEFIISGKAKL